MFKKSKNDKTTYGIVGLGRFGQALAQELKAPSEEKEKIEEGKEASDT